MSWEALLLWLPDAPALALPEALVLCPLDAPALAPALALPLDC
jgi:hypothetical protein